MYILPDQKDYLLLDYLFDYQIKKRAHCLSMFPYWMVLVGYCETQEVMEAPWYSVRGL